MKTFTVLAVLAAGAELASAGFFDSSKFSCPSNTNNECNPQQNSGFDWSDLNLGSFEGYGDFSFSGWECASSFGSGRKRDVLTGRNFQDKCITGQASHDQSNSPSFGCGNSPSVKDFSVTEFEVSVEFDCELEFHYQMPDKSTCKQKSRCSKGGSVVKNQQCGGATSVTIIYPTQTTGTGTTKTACSLGVHSMSFDCSSASTTKVYSTKSQSTSIPTIPASTLATTTSVSSVSKLTSTKPVSVPGTTLSSVTKDSSSSSVSVPGTTSSSVIKDSSSSSVSIPQTTPSTSVPETTRVLTTSSARGFFNSSSSVVVPSSSAPVSSSSVKSLTTSVLTTSVLTTPVPTISVPTSSVPTTPVPTTAVETPSVSKSSTTSVDIVTVIISTSTTVCPFTSTHVTGGTTSTEIGTTTSTIVSTLTSTICTKCSAAQVTPSGTTTAPGPVETAPCPDVLPSCLNTWLFSEGCSSNTDSDCYCPSATFVQNVFDCLSAHSADDDEISQAQDYFQGICAVHIPQNPAIVTCATTALSTTAQPSATTVPVTTIQIYSTLTVPVLESTGISSGSIIPSTSTTTLLSTYLTVPQVIFTTLTGTSTVSANLVAGTPKSNPAVTTPAPAVTTIPVPNAPGTFSASKTVSKNFSATATPLVSTNGGAQKTFAFSSVFGAILIAALAL